MYCVSIALKARANQAGAEMTTIHLQDPRLSPAFFDMLIVPVMTECAVIMWL